MNKSIRLSRRRALTAAGVVVGLPALESISTAADTRPDRRANRMVAINIGLGLHQPNIVPTRPGRDFDLPPYLRELSDLRESFTFISGTSHPGVGGGHQSGKSFLTAAKHPSSAGFKNSISIDQLAAEQLGAETRFRSLSLSTSGPGLSWSRSGVEVPTDTSPSRVFNRLFLEGKAIDRQRQIQRLNEGRSVLDSVLEQANQMQQRISGRDRQKMDQYMAAVREAESRLAKAQAWSDRPKPQVAFEAPEDPRDPALMLERLDLMYAMMRLTLETDSTRFITLNHTGMNAVPKIPGVDTDYHMLSHHGMDPQKIEQLTIIETQLVKQLAAFLGDLAAANEGEGSILDDTMVLFGSNLGNASSHDTKNLPILLAGGGFRHGEHLAFDSQSNAELPKLFVTMLRQLGLNVDTFGDSHGPLEGLVSR
jgi:hypothetical protein